MRYCEASAKDNFNVDEIFLKLVDDILSKVEPEKSKNVLRVIYDLKSVFPSYIVTVVMFSQGLVLMMRESNGYNTVCMCAIVSFKDRFKPGLHFCLMLKA